MLTFIITLLIAGIFFALIIGSIVKKPITDPSISKPSDIYKSKTLKSDTINFDDSETMVGKYLVVDTETTGLPKSKYYPIEDSDVWPFILQIAWIILDKDLKFVESFDGYLDYKGEIPYEATQVNQIDKAKIKAFGQPTKEVLLKFIQATQSVEYIVAHNADFDVPIILAELYRNNLDNSVKNIPTICTMNTTVDFVGAINRSGYPKKPRLEELYLRCFYGSIYTGTVENKHNAYNDVMLTAACFRYLIENSVLTSEGKIYKTPKLRHVKIKSDPISTIKNIDAPKTKPKKTPIVNFHEKIDSQHLKPAFEEVNETSNPFYKKKVVISGTFERWQDRNDLALILKTLGADIDTSISKRTDYLVAGNKVGPTKLMDMQSFIKLSGKGQIINESEVFDLIRPYL